MNRAFLVLGCEASGTRWLTSLFIGAGCAGTAQHVQPYDDRLPDNAPLIVLRRSVPYWGRYPHLPADIKRLRRAGYDVRAVVIVRDWQIVRRAQARAGHVVSEHEAQRRMVQAAGQIHAALLQTNTPYTVVTYESLLLHPQEAIADLFDYLELPTPPVEAIDGNAKYYAGVLA